MILGSLEFLWVFDSDYSCMLINGSPKLVEEDINGDAEQVYDRSRLRVSVSCRILLTKNFIESTTLAASSSTI